MAPVSGGEIRPAGVFVLRAPLLPFDDLLAWSEGLEAPAAWRRGGTGGRGRAGGRGGGGGPRAPAGPGGVEGGPPPLPARHGLPGRGGGRPRGVARGRLRAPVRAELQPVPGRRTVAPGRTEAV